MAVSRVTNKQVLKIIGNGPRMFKEIRSKAGMDEWDFRALDFQLQTMKRQGLIWYERKKVNGGPGWLPVRK